MLVLLSLRFYTVSLCNGNLPCNTKKTKLNISSSVQTLLGCTILQNIATAPANGKAQPASGASSWQQYKDKSRTRAITTFYTGLEQPGGKCRREGLRALVTEEWGGWVAWLGGKWPRSKPRREGSYNTSLRHPWRGRSGEDPQPQSRNSRKNGGEKNTCKKQPTWLTPSLGHIKAFLSRGLNSCY